MNRFFRSAFFPLIVIVLLVWLASETLFPKGTEHGGIADSKIPDKDDQSEAKPEIWENFDDFKKIAMKLKDASAKAAGAAEQGKGTFTAAFNDMTKVCKECHETYREKLEQ